MTMKRNPFFLPSGFEPQEAINLLEAKGDNKKRLDKIKERKRQEKSHIKRFQYNSRLCNISTKRHDKIINSNKETDQIQYGFDLVKWWGEQHE